MINSFIKSVKLKHLTKALIKEGFNEKFYSKKLLYFSKDDKIFISIDSITECVRFTNLPLKDFSNPSTKVGLHLFCRLFKKSKDLDSFCETIKSL